MKHLLLFLVGIASILYLEVAVGHHYCGWKYADPCVHYANRLTLCGAKWKHFASSCTSDARIVDIPEEKVLNFINEKRNKIANSKPASKMNRLYWCKELALIAEHSVRLCKDTEAFCAKTYRFNRGYLYTREYPFDKDKPIDMSALNKWWDTFEKAYKDGAKSFAQPKDAEGFAHFAYDLSTHVGCAASRYTLHESKHKFLFACAFSHSPIFSRPYQFGLAASECPSGVKSLDYEGLCEVSESEVTKVSDAC